MSADRPSVPPDLTPVQAARLVGCTRSELDELAADGTLPVDPDTGRFRGAEIFAYAAKRLAANHARQRPRMAAYDPLDRAVAHGPAAPADRG